MSRKRIFAALLSVALLYISCSKTTKGDLDVADHLYAEQRYSEALVFYQRYLEEYGESKNAADVYLKVGGIYYLVLQDIPQAVQSYDKVVEGWPNTDVATTALEKKAELLGNQGNFRDAIAAYEGLLKYPKAYGESGDRYRYFIGNFYLKLHDYDQARLELEGMISAYPKSKWVDRAYLDIAETYFLKQDWKEAIKSYQRMIKECPDSPLVTQAKFSWALSLENMGEWDEALRIFEGMKNQYPNPGVIEKKIDTIQKRRSKAGRG